MTAVRVATMLPDPAATERFGVWLGQHLSPGDVVGLVGELGAGKTTLVRGIAVGLGSTDPDAVASPTYLLVVEHPGRTPLLHADAYLPKKLEGFLEDGGLDYLLDPRAVLVVEWGQRIAKHLPARTLWIEFTMPAGGGRRLELRVQSPSHFPWLGELPKMEA
jgi:tRNA threonylcarbamoyladenosine biosynthesis protein TsaE